MKTWKRAAICLVGFFTLFLAFRAGLQQVWARPQAPTGKSSMRKADFRLLNGVGPLGLEVRGQGGLPLRLWYADEGRDWPKPRRLQVFVVVYETERKPGGGPRAVLTTWANPEVMATAAGVPTAADEVTHDIALQPGEYAFEVCLCDPDQGVEDGPWRMDYQPPLEKYPGKVLRVRQCRVTVE
jgi:hypothetical protein